jgi:hypothetical protein
MGFGLGAKPYPVEKKFVEKPPRNSAGFCGGGQGLSWAVEPRIYIYIYTLSYEFCTLTDLIILTVTNEQYEALIS